MVVKNIWEGVVHIGYIMEGDEWYPGKCRYLNGYTSKRKILCGDHDYNVTCRIYQSTTNRPLFECIAKENEAVVAKTTATNPTTAVKKLLQATHVMLSFKNGGSFFGLDRQEVITLQNNIQKEPMRSLQESSEKCITHVCAQRQASWFGVVSFGTPNYDPKFQCTLGRSSFRLQPGYESLRCIMLPDDKEVILHCRIDVDNNNDIVYKCFTTDEPFVECENPKSTYVVKKVFQLLGIESKKKWSGYEFFGFMKPEVLNRLNNPEDKEEVSSSVTKKYRYHEALKQGMQVRMRNAGETSSLKNAKSIKHRNEVVHKLVEYISFGDVKSYVQYLCEQYPDVIEGSVEKVPSLERRFIDRLKISTQTVDIDCSITAELLLGKCSLSQRGYKNLRKILEKNNIKIPTYEKVRTYCTETDVGKIDMIHGNSDNQECKCMGVKVNIKETLQQVVSCQKLFSEFNFYNTEEQGKIFSFLKRKNSELYKNLDTQKRTIFIRDTGDNFRAASRYPTEQTSFSILNINKLVNCPYGQFITTLWRGMESRYMISTHVGGHYVELTELVQHGVTLVINGILEHFNVVTFFVADLCFLKDVIGLCSCISTYGCYHCLLARDAWSAQQKKNGQERSISQLSQKGKSILNLLGQSPDHNSAKFKKVQLSNHGQWTTTLFKGFITDLMPPCGLHLILAHHRYLYKFMYDVINKRGMDSMIPAALQKIGCGYLGYQIGAYFKSKKKNYDGSETLKMIGNDCKLMEDNIDTFLYTFIKTEIGEMWESESCLKLRQVLHLYKVFKDLACDIRSTAPNEDRANSFEQRAEKFFSNFLSVAGTTSIKGLPYLHYLRNHVGKLMVLYADLFKWGYGMFTCNAGEHLNKRIKFSEINETNMGKNRFFTVTHMMRLKQFRFTDCIMPLTKEIKCSACHQNGHNKKNKSCPMHPSHPPIQFEESDNDED